MDLRAIPATQKYLATAAPHHGQAFGTLIQIDPAVVDDDEVSQVKRFTPEVPFAQSEGGGRAYATAWPLNEFFCLCVYDDLANAVDAVEANYGIYPLALRRRASEIEPDVLGSNPLSFPLLVQPVLDRHCVECHGGKVDDAPPDLRPGDPARQPRGWLHSYANLEPYAFFYTDQVFTAPRTTPGKFGARASRLLELLEKGHEGTKPSDEDLYRITLWLDCNSDFFGAYEHTEAQAAGKIVTPSLE